MRKLLLGSFVVAMLCGHASFALQRYVSSNGNDLKNNCSVLTNPCRTLQHAVDQSNNNDGINMTPGVYTVDGLVLINKSVTILGAQAGIDARTRGGPETVLSFSQGLAVSANNVVLDGLVIQDSRNENYSGFGVWLNPNVDGTVVINTIFQNNIVGLGLANAGVTQSVIQQNVFRNNNQPGPASGSGIYTDQFVGGRVANVLISDNLFDNNENAGIGISTTDTLNPNSNIEISNNTITNCGRGIYVYSTINSIVVDNQIINTTVPTDGGYSIAIGVYGGVSDLEIMRNNLQTGAGYGVRLYDFIGDSPNSNINVHQNNLMGFSTSALAVHETPQGTANFATCNWWGDASGPAHNALNPSGTGDKIEGGVVLDNFNPWLVAPGPNGPCGISPPTITTTFSPNTIQIGKTSNLRIVLGNPNTDSANMTAPLVDNLPPGLFVSSFTSNSCGGSVIALPGSSSIILLNGSIPAEGFCRVMVKVKTWTIGTYINTISVDGLMTDKGSNVSPTSDTLKAICANCTVFAE